MIEITKNNLKQGHRVRPGKKITVQYICIHSTGNPTSTALNERAWLDNPTNTRDASWNYCIDEKTCVEAIPAGEEAWAQQSGNSSCISVEICESGNREKTVARAAEFAAQLLNERGWGIDKLKRHTDFYASKICPAIFYKNGSWAQWEAFKVQVNSYLTNKTIPVATEKEILYATTKKGKVTTASLNIRPDASINKNPIGTLKANEVIDLFGESGKFYKLKTGYASKDYITIVETPQAAPVKPEVTTNWKLSELKYLQDEGIDFDYETWKKQIDDPMPAWAVFILMARMHRNLKK